MGVAVNASKRLEVQYQHGHDTKLSCPQGSTVTQRMSTRSVWDRDGHRMYHQQSCIGAECSAYL